MSFTGSMLVTGYFIRNLLFTYSQNTYFPQNSANTCSDDPNIVSQDLNPSPQHLAQKWLKNVPEIKQSNPHGPRRADSLNRRPRTILIPIPFPAPKKIPLPLDKTQRWPRVKALKGFSVSTEAVERESCGRKER